MTASEDDPTMPKCTSFRAASRGQESDERLEVHPGVKGETRG